MHLWDRYEGCPTENTPQTVLFIVPCSLHASLCPLSMPNVFSCPMLSISNTISKTWYLGLIVSLDVFLAPILAGKWWISKPAPNEERSRTLAQLGSNAPRFLNDAAIAPHATLLAHANIRKILLFWFFQVWEWCSHCTKWVVAGIWSSTSKCKKMPSKWGGPSRGDPHLKGAFVEKRSIQICSQH